MNDLTLIKKTNYNGTEISVYNESGKPERWYTREEIGRALGYKFPRQAIAQIHDRNKNVLDSVSGVAKLDTPSGIQETFIYNQKGVYIICLFSARPQAKDFLSFIYDQMQEAIPRRQLPTHEFNKVGFGDEVLPETPLLLPIAVSVHYINNMTPLNRRQLVSLLREATDCARDCQKTAKHLTVEKMFGVANDERAEKRIEGSLVCMHAFLGMAYRVMGMK